MRSIMSQMIPNDPTLSGSIVLVKGTHFLSKQIMMHMWMYAKMTGRKPLKFSHAETLIWSVASNCLYTVGARENGTDISLINEYYRGQEILILKPKVPLTPHENLKLFYYCQKVDKSKYQTGNFLSWITWLKTGIWLSKKGDNLVYCYELSARFANAIGRWPEGKSLDMVSIFDLYENQNYEIHKP